MIWRTTSFMGKLSVMRALRSQDEALYSLDPNWGFMPSLEE